jgi:hypothetical protein
MEFRVKRTLQVLVAAVLVLPGCDDKGWSSRDTKDFMESCGEVNASPDAPTIQDCECELKWMREKGITFDKWRRAAGTPDESLVVMGAALCTSKAGEARWTEKRKAEFHEWCSGLKMPKATTCDCVLSQLIMRNLDYPQLKRLLSTHEEAMMRCFPK